MDAEFSNVTVLRLPRNFGKTRARNIGARTAKAELVFFLDPEVEVTPGAVMDIAAAVEADPQAVAAIPHLLDEEGRPGPAAGRLPGRAALAAACRTDSGLPLGPIEGDVEFTSDAALLVRRSFLRGLNFLDEKRYSEYWGEVELFWRIHDAGKRIVVATAPVTLHRRKTSFQVPRSEQALLAADRVAGAAAFVGKHEGWSARFSFVAGQFFSALGAALREPGYGLRLAMGILNGHRIDGTQGGQLG